MKNGRAAGNISIAISIVLSRGTFERLSNSSHPICSRTTFYKIIKTFFIPAIHWVFVTQRQLLFDDPKEGGKTDLLGNGRCDSPGYNPKYGTYTVMDKQTGMIMDMHVSYVGVAGNSARMELDGLSNALQSSDDNVINISSLTTDRHKQIRSFLRKKQKDIRHQFDVWHFAKNIKKHILKAAKEKCCSELGPWIKAIINHFWWCCATCRGDLKLLREKWISILYHIKNVRKWEDHSLFKECAHRKYKLQEMKSKAWFKESLFAYAALKKLF